MYLKTSEHVFTRNRMYALHGLGQTALQPFGPAAMQNALPFQLTNEQIKTILTAQPKVRGVEAFFYIHEDVAGVEPAYRFGGQRVAAEGLLHQSDYNHGAATDESEKLTRKDRQAGRAAPNYQARGFGHSHPQSTAGKPSGTDLGNFAKIATATPIIGLVFGTLFDLGMTMRPGAVDRSSAGSGSSNKKFELDASVVWRAGYKSLPDGRLVVPPLALPSPVNYASHQEAAAAMRRISPDVTFKYFAGKIAYDGQFSSEFVEVR